MTEHPSFDQFCEYSEGKLEGDSRIKLEQHLATGCELCTTELNRVQRLTHALEATRWPAPPPAVRARVMKSFNRIINPNQPRRARLRWALAGGVLLMLLVFVTSPTWKTQPAFAATLIEMVGPVYIVASPAGADQPAELGQSIAIAASIKTGPGAHAALSLPGEITIRLGEGTELRLSKLSRTEDHWHISLFQSKGETESSVQPNVATFTLQTPAGEIVALGTLFIVRVDDHKTTIVSVAEGKVQVNSPSESVDVPAGMTAYFSAGKSATVIPGPQSTPSPDSEPEQDATPSVRQLATESTEISDLVEPTPENGTPSSENTDVPEEDESSET